MKFIQNYPEIKSSEISDKNGRYISRGEETMQEANAGKQKGNHDFVTLNKKMVRMNSIHRETPEIIPRSFFKILANKAEKFETERNVRRLA
ncbi:hypothetical protein ACFL52_05050 [Candidatus Margulisiibacteriota bacterium]